MLRNLDQKEVLARTLTITLRMFIPVSFLIDLIFAFHLLTFTSLFL